MTNDLETVTSALTKNRDLVQMGSEMVVEIRELRAEVARLKKPASMEPAAGEIAKCRCGGNPIPHVDLNRVRCEKAPVCDRKAYGNSMAEAIEFWNRCMCQSPTAPSTPTRDDCVKRLREMIDSKDWTYEATALSVLKWIIAELQKLQPVPPPTAPAAAGDDSWIDNIEKRLSNWTNDSDVGTAVPGMPIGTIRKLIAAARHIPASPPPPEPAKEFDLAGLEYQADRAVEDPANAREWMLAAKREIERLRSGSSQ